MHRLIARIFLLQLYTIFTSAQTGVICGKVLDAGNHRPVEYATIIVTDTLDHKAVTGGITDSNGVFFISNVPAGTYKIGIDFIGFKSMAINGIAVINSSHPTTLPDILLEPSSNAMQNITVTADAPVIENKIDKIVYNAGNDVSTQGGAATDILKKVPQVSVDADGNVELQGNPNIRFLINGKPSSLFGSSVVDALATIPASQIKSIEVITSPGAKYDAQGTGGIINIILKENKMQGVNASISLSAGTRLENGSFNLNVRQGKVGINTFFSGNAQLSSHTPYNQDRTSADSTARTTTHLVQDGYTDFQRSGYQTGIGFDWALTKRDNITGGLSVNHFGNQSTGYISQEEKSIDASGAILTDVSGFRNSENHFHNTSVDWNINYQRKFARDGQELDIACNASYGKPLTDYSQLQMYTVMTSPYQGIASNNPGTDHQTNISIAYSHPVNDHLLIEAGVKTILQKISSNTDVSVYNPSNDQFLPDATQSYYLSYNLNVYSGYLSTTYSPGNFLTIKAGLRYEYTAVSLDYANTRVPSYGTWVPSVIFSHKLGKDQTVKLMYSHRIERPDYDELNPFENLSDPYNITTGNPQLKPEIGNNFELGYSRNFKGGGNIYVAAIERINSQDIKPVTSFYPIYQIGDSLYNNVSVTTRQNIGSEYNSGITAFGSVPVMKHMTISGNLMAGQRYIISDLPGTGTLSSGLAIRSNLTITAQLPWDITAEGFVNFRSAWRNIQGTMPQSLTYTLALRRQFWHNAGSVGLTATNVLSAYISQKTTTQTESYSSIVIREIPYRSFGLTFTYKFGRLEFKKGKDEDGDYKNNMPTISG